jgi:hypothetical protein
MRDPTNERASEIAPLFAVFPATTRLHHSAVATSARACCGFGDGAQRIDRLSTLRGLSDLEGSGKTHSAPMTRSPRVPESAAVVV